MTLNDSRPLFTALGTLVFVGLYLCIFRATYQYCVNLFKIDKKEKTEDKIHPKNAYLNIAGPWIVISIFYFIREVGTQWTKLF